MMHIRRVPPNLTKTHPFRMRSHTIFRYDTHVLADRSFESATISPSSSSRQRQQTERQVVGSREGSLYRRTRGWEPLLWQPWLARPLLADVGQINFSESICLLRPIEMCPRTSIFRWCVRVSNVSRPRSVSRTRDENLPLQNASEQFGGSETTKPAWRQWTLESVSGSPTLCSAGSFASRGRRFLSVHTAPLPTPPPAPLPPPPSPPSFHLFETSLLLLLFLRMSLLCHWPCCVAIGRTEYLCGARTCVLISHIDETKFAAPQIACALSGFP